ncbi:LuxR C-terminal-related transcriptional regulator [Enterobacter asburiae]|uniref:helix-turn-helix transcriptional regulator n=1 Tax=Scandinavium sp. UTDF21-P1B TaxID=3446379 RepID=UPI00346A6E97
MFSTVRIYIDGHDNYFNQGVEYALIEYFSTQKRYVDFIRKEGRYEDIDLVVWTPENENGRLITAFLPPSIIQSRILIVLRKENGYHFSDCAEWVFFRHQNKQDLAILLENILHSSSPQEIIKKKLHERTESLLTALTFQQREIIYYLARGAALKDIAIILGIEYKTASHHKRKIMKMLSLNKNTKLYNWMLERMERAD